MTEYRIDYITKSGKRGTWEYELEYENADVPLRELAETLKYAKSRMPDIEKLVLVEITERDLN